MQTKIISGFTLIEILVTIIIVSILSSAGVVGYKNYISNTKDTASYKNYQNIVNMSETEFTKCKLDNNSLIFGNHRCSSSSEPSSQTIANYFNNNLNLKNPYNNNQPAIQSNICSSGAVTIQKNQKGSYNMNYASINKKTKYTSLVSSQWSSNYSKTSKTSVSFSCASASSASSASTQKQTIFNYKPPHNGPGAGIIVDQNGNMVKGQGAHACGANCFQANSAGMKNWWIMINGQKVYPNRAGSPYRFVMAEGANPNTGNIASSCAGGNCKYNFSSGTYTVLNTGKTYKAGVPPSQRKPVSP